MYKYLYLLIMVFLTIETSISQDRSTGKSFATRSEVIAQNGMAATSQPLATMVAIDILKKGGSAIDAPYNIRHTRTLSAGSDSPLRQGAYRCLAATANNFARESFMDELAHAAGADPVFMEWSGERTVTRFGRTARLEARVPSRETS